MGQGTVIDKNAFGLDRAWFIYQVHCRPGIELKEAEECVCSPRGSEPDQEMQGWVTCGEK